MRDDPLAGFLFRLSLGNIEIAGFAECAGLEIETKVFEYREGGRNSHALRFPEGAGVKNLTLKRGLTLSSELFDWCVDVARGTFSHANQRPARQLPGHSPDASQQDSERKVSVALVDHGGSVLKEWRLRRAFPVKWSGPELKAQDSSAAFEMIELAHEGIEEIRA